MTLQDKLAAIRARDAADWPVVPNLELFAQHNPDDEELRQAIHQVRDRRVLLHAYDALAAAARKVTDGLATERGCGECWPKYGACGSACRMTDCAAVQTLLDEVNP